MKNYTFIDNVVKNLYKDAHGVEPNNNWINIWNLSSSDHKQKIWNELCQKIDDLSNENYRRKKNDT